MRISDWSSDVCSSDLKPEDRERDQKTLERVARARLAELPGVRVSYISSEPGELMQLVLAGDDPHRLQEAAIALERDLRGIDGLGSVTSSASLLRPEIVITPDPAQIGRASGRERVCRTCRSRW